MTNIRKQVVHPQPQTPQEESVAKQGIPLLIILSLVCKSDIKKVLGNMPRPLFEKNVRWQNLWLAKVDKKRQRFHVWKVSR